MKVPKNFGTLFVELLVMDMPFHWKLSVLEQKKLLTT